MIVICLIVLKPFEALEPTACVFLNHPCAFLCFSNLTGLHLFCVQSMVH